MALKRTYTVYSTLSYTCKYFIILSTCKYFIIWNKILFYFLSGFTWLEVTSEHFTGSSLLTFGPVQNTYTALHWINPAWGIKTTLQQPGLREISQSEVPLLLIALHVQHFRSCNSLPCRPTILVLLPLCQPWILHFRGKYNNTYVPFRQGYCYSSPSRILS